MKAGRGGHFSWKELQRLTSRIVEKKNLENSEVQGVLKS